jgi:hypothetical protein
VDDILLKIKITPLPIDYDAFTQEQPLEKISDISTLLSKEEILKILPNFEFMTNMAGFEDIPRFFQSIQRNGNHILGTIQNRIDAPNSESVILILYLMSDKGELIDDSVELHIGGGNFTGYVKSKFSISNDNISYVRKFISTDTGKSTSEVVENYSISEKGFVKN